MRGLLVPTAVVLVIAGAAPAWAHEEISPPTVPTNKPAFLILSAANEKKVDLSKVTITAPVGGDFGEATRDPAGWTSNRTGTVITWTGGAVKPSRFEQFGFEVEELGQPGTFTYKVNLAYSDGTSDNVDVPVLAASAVASPGGPEAASSSGSDSGDGRANVALGLSVVALLGAVGALVVSRRRPGAGSPPSATGTPKPAAGGQDW